MIAGCASTPETEQIQPGSVALVAAHYPPASRFNAYAKGRGANALKQGGASALDGALKGARAAGSGPAAVAQVFDKAPVLGGLAAVVTVVAAVAGGVVGGVIGGTAGVVEGASSGLPSAQVDAIHQPVESARRDAAIHVAMSQQVLALEKELPRHRLTYLPELGPRSSGETPDYRALKAQQYEAVLELAVTSIGFEATPGNPPAAAFEMKLRARVVPLHTDVMPWSREQTYRGTPRTLPQWQADQGQLLQEELDASYRSLAQFVAGLFYQGPPIGQAPEPVKLASLAPAATTHAYAAPVVGDSWTYRLTGSGRSHSQRHHVTIVSVASDAVVERLGDQRSPAQTMPLKGGYLMRQGAVSLFSPYYIPGGWGPIANIRERDADPFCGAQWICSISGTVKGKDWVRVPAGEFETIRVEVQHAWTGRAQNAESAARTLTIWYSPQTKRAVKFSSRGTGRSAAHADFDLELESYSLN